MGAGAVGDVPPPWAPWPLWLPWLLGLGLGLAAGAFGGAVPGLTWPDWSSQAKPTDPPSGISSWSTPRLA